MIARNGTTGDCGMAGMLLAVRLRLRSAPGEDSREASSATSPTPPASRRWAPRCCCSTAWTGWSTAPSPTKPAASCSIPSAAGAYSIRVSLASFLPALKRNIVVQPGMRSLLSVNLAGVLSSIELVYSATGSRAIMSDDWKWVLRSSSATRPVLRLRPSDYGRRTGRQASASSLFSDTHGMVKISAGDQGSVSQFGNEPDLGTAFALATSLFGDNQVHVSGNFGYSAATGIPTAGFRTSYSRGLGGQQLVAGEPDHAAVVSSRPGWERAVTRRQQGAAAGATDHVGRPAGPDGNWRRTCSWSTASRWSR